MPRPNPDTIAFTIDGLEVNAPAGMMLVDAAKLGDVEIPYFCYEPKLGQPVGACRQCLVEIEGIPKLQVACSTPVRDGMVVHTQTDRVKEAQAAIVEFLLINHPLDCPVCDAGGECPLQDIAFGWGPGRSRFIEPKRHFVKPLELSPLIAIDRERCILCYRCVRFSQEISEDYQLVLQERTADTYVATFNGHPYVAPFSGNIIDLCPVGALTSQPYRFRARPWDIEGAGSVCTLCPSQCNVALTVRDERVLRVQARDHPEVDDGWLCDKGRFAYQAVHVDQRIAHPLVRIDGELVPVSWDRALDEAAAALSAAGSEGAAIAGGETTNEEGWLLQELMRGALGSPNVDSRTGGSLPRELHAALHAPALQATVADLEFAHAVLVLDCEPVDDAPILDLRIRKGMRRNRVKLAVATSRPSSLDPNAACVARYAPGAGEAFCAALNAALGGSGVVGELAAAAGADAAQVTALAELLSDAGEDLVIVYGERLTHGARGEHAARALLNVAGRLVQAGHDGAGLLELPVGTNGRGLREAGVLPNAGPGLAPVGADGLDSAAIGATGAAGALGALYLLHVDPLRDLPSRRTWRAALERTESIVAHAQFLTPGLWEYATVVFPAEAYAEKEGTITHPDGRVQRLRPGIARPGAVRAEWSVIADVAARLGHDLGVLSGPMASARLFEAVPFYAGLTLDELGGRGLRWPARPAAAAWPAADIGPFGLETPLHAPTDAGALRLGTFRSIWAAPQVELSPALKFLHARQRAELSPRDAQRLGVAHGDRVTVSSNGSRVQATAVLRSTVPEGSIFLEEGISEDSASELDADL
ncbi:MAG TPA: NADH-quinone oxidoreductase subunit NuoG, partial [Solirubrobacteraceae bacterium]|nr:NADH-quinone oxidoreductase subunit NuoG [Solirubrobacteraceae bacterium]